MTVHKTAELIAYCSDCKESEPFPFALHSDGEACEGEWLGECLRGHTLTEADLEHEGRKTRDYGTGRLCNCLTYGCYEPEN